MYPFFEFLILNIALTRKTTRKMIHATGIRASIISKKECDKCPSKLKSACWMENRITEKASAPKRMHVMKLSQTRESFKVNLHLGIGLTRSSFIRSISLVELSMILIFSVQWLS